MHATRFDMYLGHPQPYPKNPTILCKVFVLTCMRMASVQAEMCSMCVKAHFELT
jgi:hypothetical protein